MYEQLFLPRVMIMYLIAASALLFYVTKIPERYFPGQFLFASAMFGQLNKKNMKH